MERSVALRVLSMVFQSNTVVAILFSEALRVCQNCTFIVQQLG